MYKKKKKACAQIILILLGRLCNFLFRVFINLSEVVIYLTFFPFLC